MHKLRLTGGEPLIRPGLPALIEQLTALAGIDEIALTTNAVLLPRLACDLAQAGLDRITVSLDTLDPDVLDRMSGGKARLEQILEGIVAAESAGFRALKINTVVQRGVNEHAVLEMAEYFKGSGHIVRFIEYMDVGATNGWRLDDVVPASEIIDTINGRFPVEAIPPNYPGEVATRFRYLDGEGEVGVIASVTKPFCGACTRARVSAEGVLYTCLFASEGTSLRDAIRSGRNVGELLGEVWGSREDRYSSLRSSATPRIATPIEMSYIGG